MMENGCLHLVVSGVWDMICAVSVTVQHDCAMKQTAEAEMAKSAVVVLTWAVAVVDGILLKGATAYFSGRESYGSAPQDTDMP